VLIQCLLWFRMPFYVCNEGYKCRGRIWGQGDQSWGFGVENGKFPRGNTKNRVTFSGVTRHSEICLARQVAQ